MSIEAWATVARHGEYRQAVEHQRAIDTLLHLLEGKTTPETAAGTIASIYEPPLKRGPNPSPVATLWAILCEAARTLGGNKELNERLIDMLNSISKLPDVTDEHGKAISPDGSVGVYWRDLPELAIMFREYAIEADPEDETDDGNDPDVRLLNAITFGAMYLARGKQPIGMPFHAEISLIYALEVPCQTPEQHRRAATSVPRAATWILLAGDPIYKLCKDDYHRKDGAPGAMPDNDEWLWGKGRGYSLERWTWWKKRFGEIAMIPELEDDVKDRAARAASEMETIEG